MDPETVPPTQHLQGALQDQAALTEAAPEVVEQVTPAADLLQVEAQVPDHPLQEVPEVVADSNI